MKPTSFRILAFALAVFNLSWNLTKVVAFQLSIQRSSSANIRNWPLGKKVAIIVRGEAFRGDFPDGGRVPCSECAIQAQLGDTNSLILNVINPLEADGNHVEVIVTDVMCTEDTPHRLAFSCPLDGRCPLLSKILKAFDGRVSYVRQFETSGQADGMRKALDAFNEHYGGAGNIANVFDYVLVVRHDLRWLTPISQTQTDFLKFNFFGRCEATASPEMGGSNCVWDIVHLMPAKMYVVFNSVIGKGYRRGTSHDSNGCFDQHYDPAGCGHPCKGLIEHGLKNISGEAEVGFMTDVKMFARGRNDYVEMELADCHLSEF